jgi:hypothetical protein
MICEANRVRSYFLLLGLQERFRSKCLKSCGRGEGLWDPHRASSERPGGL